LTVTKASYRLALRLHCPCTCACVRKAGMLLMPSGPLTCVFFWHFFTAWCSQLWLGAHANSATLPIAHMVDRQISCTRIQSAYRRHGILSLLAPELYKREGPFQKYVEEHSAGQWLAQHALNHFHNASYLIDFLKKLHVTLLYEHPRKFAYISESLLHGSIYHLVINALSKDNMTSKSVWALTNELCGSAPQDDPTYGECLHGIGHGAFYSALFHAQVLPQREYGACSGFPNNVPFPMLLEHANSACDGAPTDSMQLMCLRGAYHASALLGDWGIPRIERASKEGANVTVLRMMFHKSILVHAALCDRYAVFRVPCKGELSDIFLLE